MCVVFIFLFSSFAFAESEPQLIEFDLGEYGYVHNGVYDTNDALFSSSDSVGVFGYKPYFGKPISSGYSLLSDNEKAYYDALNNISSSAMSVTVTYPSYISQPEFEKIDFAKIMNAFYYDRPDVFYHFGYSLSATGYNNGTYNMYKTVTYKLTPKSGTNYSESNIANYTNQLWDVIKSIDVNLTTRYDFVKSAHDYLCNSITYKNNGSTCHDAYGALVLKEAVCQGYATAFKTLCNYYKIPCIMIPGTGVTSSGSGAHMWNAVQMDDGKWYFLDITWDDQTSGIYRDFFLIGSQSVDRYFGSTSFSASHIADDTSSYLPAFNFATDKFIESNKYSGFDATYNSYADATKKELIVSCFDVTQFGVCYNGIPVEMNSYATGTDITVSSGEKWELIAVGDCNSDGSADAQDYSAVVNMVLSDKVVNSMDTKAADACRDGVLDVLDIALLERAVNGFNTDFDLS